MAFLLAYHEAGELMFDGGSTVGSGVDVEQKKGVVSARRPALR